ncbi:MAG TPA: hypothetical protein VJQ82_05980 [Terriglobales bacterium]|nr:hypothetical protein [Terriglobales bacterium]
MWRALIIAVSIAAVVLMAADAAAQTSQSIPRNAKVFIAPMENGFDTFLKDALAAKNVPLQIVDQRDQADFEIVGKSESQKASAAKKALMWDWRSTEQASINVIDLKTSEVAFAYSVHQKSSYHGRRSSAESCAKHLKDKIEQAK